MSIPNSISPPSRIPASTPSNTRASAATSSPSLANVYGNTWQTTLDGFLAVQMDHVSVRDGYHEWHGVAHMDDARQAPPNTPHFDGYRMGPDTYSPYKPGEHIPGLNVGGWFDAGDYDNDDYGQYATIQNLSLTYNTFHPKWDELTVDQKARSVEMHQPDGVPDLVAASGARRLAAARAGPCLRTSHRRIQSAWLTQYTYVGDAASQSDNLLYDPKLSPTQKGRILRQSRRPLGMDRLHRLQPIRRIGLAGRRIHVLKGWNDPLAKECLDTAVKLWNDEKTHPAPNPFRGGFAARFGSPDWSAALELMIATNGAEPYKQRVQELFPEMLKNMTFRGWTAVRALPYLDPSYKAQFKTALQAWLPQLDKQLDATPFGVPPARGDWGGAEQVADFGAEMYFLHQAFPDVVGPEYTLRAANYLLGTHPVSSESYIAAIGTLSRKQTYSNNRGDYSYIPGAMIPGYVVIKPDYPECISDFGMLWFEHETTVSAGSSWVLAANAADAIVREKEAADRPSGN